MLNWLKLYLLDSEIEVFQCKITEFVARCTTSDRMWLYPNRSDLLFNVRCPCVRMFIHMLYGWQGSRAETTEFTMSIYLNLEWFGPMTLPSEARRKRWCFRQKHLHFLCERAVSTPIIYLIKCIHSSDFFSVSIIVVVVKMRLTIGNINLHEQTEWSSTIS